MASYFFDSSAVVKRYLTETGSPWVRSITDPAAGHDIYLVHITAVEVVSALVRQFPPLLPTHLASVLSDFRQDLQRQYQIVAVTTAVIDRAMSLAEAHHLRGYDAVQLAAAVELQTVALTTGLPSFTFVCADTQLNLAAAAVGLAVDDPMQHP